MDSYIRIVIAAYECGWQTRRGHLICSCMKMCSHCTHKSGNWKYINLVQTHTHTHILAHKVSHTHMSGKGYCISCCRTRSLWRFSLCFSLSLSLVHNYANVQIALGLMTVITQAVVGGRGWQGDSHSIISLLWTWATWYESWVSSILICSSNLKVTKQFAISIRFEAELFLLLLLLLLTQLMHVFYLANYSQSENQ